MVLKEVFKTDQPGRLIAVFIIAPILAYKALKYHDTFIGVFSIVLFIWDLYWLLYAEPKVQKKAIELNIAHLIS